MKIKRSAALLLAMLLIVAIAVPVYADGRIIHIKTGEELRELAVKCRLDTYSEDLTVVLDNDIDLGDAPFDPFATFSGTFDGRGHTVSGVKLATDGAHQGFFRFIQEGGLVKNLNVQGSVNPENIRTEIGGLAGSNYGTIDNCSFSGEVRGLERVGGVAGYNFGTVKDSTFDGTAAGKRFTGGVVGYNEGTVDGCTNNGAVNTTIETAPVNIDDISISDLSAIPVVTANDSDTVTDSGGIVGLSTGVVRECVNFGVIGYPHYGYNVGGIAGRHSGFITGCENRGEVCGRKDIGGIVGQMEPFLLLTATENLISELKLLSNAISVAMTHLDENSSETSAVMSDIEADADSAISSAQEMDRNSRKPVLPSNQPGNTEGGSEADSGLNWDDVREKAEGAGQAVSDISGQLGDETMGNITSGDIGNITDEDWTKIGEVGGEVIGDAGDKISERIDERKAEKEAEEAAEAQRQQNYNNASSGLSASMGNMSGNIARLNAKLSESTSDLANDMQVVNLHFYRAMDILGNILSGNNIVYQDISDEDTTEQTEGKVFGCVNSGSVDGDIGIGGIAGDMGIEIEYDLEGVITEKIDTSITSNIYETRCVARNCVNNGPITGKKNYIGGVAGYTELGCIIGCEGYGTVNSESGSYVGGIVGRSDTVVRESYAMCAISGAEYVGGIAGTGVKIRDCGSRVTVSAFTASVGAIAGKADVRAEEEVAENSEEYGTDEVFYVRGNRFVSETLGGVDGVSYRGKAEPMSDEEFIENEAVPRRFREVIVTFAADGAVVTELKGIFGQGFAAEDIPEVPEKAGYTGYWPEFDFDRVRGDAVLKAEYRPNQSSIASKTTRGGDMSVLLLNGSFADCAYLELKEFEDYGPPIRGVYTLEKWEYTVENDRGKTEDYSIRYMTPETNNKRGDIEIYVLNGETWVKADTRQSGSYTVFDGSGSHGVFAAMEFAPDNTLLYAGGAAAAVLVVILIMAALVKKRKKRKSSAVEPACSEEIYEEPAAESGEGNTDRAELAEPKPEPEPELDSSRSLSMSGNTSNDK